MGLYWSCNEFPNIHRLFKVRVDELMHIIYVLAKEINLSYADMNNMPFYEIIKIIEVYKENMEEQKKQHDRENGKMERQMSSLQSQYKPENMTRNMSSNFKPPTFNMPTPKF